MGKGIIYFFLLITIGFEGYSQSSNSVETQLGEKRNQPQRKTYLGIEINAGVMPKAIIRRYEGDYKLISRIQSSYDLGINFIWNFKNAISLITGIHFTVGKRNFFAKIPNSDLPGSFGAGTNLLIESKDLWGCMRLPVLIEKKIKFGNNSDFYGRLGVNLRYSGFMADESFVSAIRDQNNQRFEVFNASFSASNQGRPWITFLLGGSRYFSLDNKNLLVVGLNTDVSPVSFFKGRYEFTIPNKPVSSGTYQIHGTSISLSVQYVFTGYNKRKVKEYLQN